MNAYEDIRIEGGLLSPDLLENLSERAGQRPADFGLERRRSVLDEATAAWGEARMAWEAFQRRLAGESESATSVTREQWVLPLLETLGYRLSYQRRAALVDGRSYTISHRAGEDEQAPPVHIVGIDQQLGSRNPSGRANLSPHALLQDYLNRSEHLWGIVTNGYVLRLLRDSTSFTRPTYVEFDLRNILEGQRLDEFIVFYRLVHRTRLPKEIDDAADCLLERYYQEAIEQGGRIRDQLREAVEKTILTLAQGFLDHPDNEPLRERIRSGNLTAAGLYQDMLYLVYRLLFLLVAEERHLIGEHLPAAGPGNGSQATSRAAYYREYLSLARLRALVEQPLSAPERFDDLYLGLRTLFAILRDEKWCAPLGLAPLNGELFEPRETLDSTMLNNRDLLQAVASLAYFEPEGERVLRRVNYAALDVEELGSVYESLLDYRPDLHQEQGRYTFEFAKGTERKTTGSYYTRPELVRELVQSALEPVIAQRLQAARSEGASQEQALLSLRVCDPACGSGHFLLAAARRIGLELARVRTGHDEPAPEEVRAGVRDAVIHCIYGVDRNPLAVDLCKVALWIEGHCEGRPLTFLNAHIRCGDSLVGVFDLDMLQQGIPDEAYTAASGDDKKVASDLKKRNKREREGQLELWGAAQPRPPQEALATWEQLLEMPEDTPEQVRRKRAAFERLQRSAAWRHLLDACHLWTAPFFLEVTPRTSAHVPTTALLRAHLSRPAGAGASTGAESLAHAQAVAQRLRFFHWPLEFPEVFARGGFDVVLSNPPWERIKLQEQEFFAGLDRAIANAPNKAARGRLIQALPKQNPALWRSYQEALHDAEALSGFLRNSGRYPLTGRGDINTYSVFAELLRRLTTPQGRAGILVPTGIATDDTNKLFFGDLIETGSLVSLYDFENREGLFPGVHRSFKFCLLTVGKAETSQEEARFAFFLTQAGQLRDPQRVFSLTRDDLLRLNPNTRTCPIFRTRADAEITRKIYERVPVLINEGTGQNPWGASFMRMFDMSNDSGLFRTREQLESEGYRLQGNHFVREDGQVYLPLYEAKMIWHFDHRFSSYETVEGRGSTHLPDTSEEQHQDPRHVIQPWYWVPQDEVVLRCAQVPPALLDAYRLGDPWLIGWALSLWVEGYEHNQGRTELMDKVRLRLIDRPWYASWQGVVKDIIWPPITKSDPGEMDRRYPLGPEQLRILEQWETENVVELARKLILSKVPRWFLGFRDISNATNERTTIFSLLPQAGVGNKVPLLIPEQPDPVLALCLLGNCDSLPFDFVSRQKIGGTSLNFFYVKQFAVLPPEAYQAADLRFIVPRVLELVYTSWDMKPFADEVWEEADDALCAAIEAQIEANGRATGGHRWESAPAWLDVGDSGFPPFRWDESRRAVLRAELDAYYARLYGLTEQELRYILDPEDVHGPDFPGETFRVLKEKELRAYGEYRTRRLVLEAWARLK